MSMYMCCLFPLLLSSPSLLLSQPPMASLPHFYFPNLLWSLFLPPSLFLIQTAYAYGYVLLSRSPVLIRLQTPRHGILEYDILHILEFSPERKCMSVIVRERDHKGRLMLYSKGADSTIYSNLASVPLLYSQQNGEDETVANVTLRHVNSYAQRGLRILCMARRVSFCLFGQWCLMGG